MRRLALFSLAAVACVPRPSGEPVSVDYEAGPVIQPGDPEALAYDLEMFPGAKHDARITRPAAVLGRPVGSRLAHHAEIVELFQTWATESPRVTVETYGTTHEGRELLRVIITSEANHKRLTEIRGNLRRLFDPRELKSADAKAIIADTPPVGWLGYSIHGDEVSGADASVAVGYHLIAGEGEDVKKLLDRIVVVIDPVMNPDGRERILGMVEQSSGEVPNTDYASLHRGRWPRGRGNHYLFDMNRDWIVGAAPETRGRWKAQLDLPPQLVVDAHEMGATDTYLFYPQSPPYNENLPRTLANWHSAFARDHAAAFDRYAWGYYTREWADALYPGYSDSWASLNGGVGILYEQSSTKGQPLRRPSGKLVTYRQTVHGHAVSSLANLQTLANNAEAILTDYLAARREALEGGTKVLAIAAGVAPDRERELVLRLMRQGIEVYRADADFKARGQGPLGAAELHAFPAGSYLIPAAQPQGRLVHALLDLDPRIDRETVHREREDLERKGTSRLYDVTAWNFVHATGLDAWWVPGPAVKKTQVTRLDPPPAGVVGADARSAVAWVVDGSLDASVAFAAAAMEAGVAVHLSDREFTAGGVAYPRGSVLVRRHENDEKVGLAVAGAAKKAGVRVAALATLRSPDEGPDLGGQHFELLARPRVAVLSNSPVSPSDYGHVWHELDRRLGIPFSILDAQALGHYDLRRYNVIIVPPARGNVASVLADPSVKAWVSGGGTLIALGGSASAVASGDLGLSQVRRRHDVLEQLPAYGQDIAREVAAREIEVDEKELWDGPQPEPEPETKAGATAQPEKDADKKNGGPPPGDPEALARHDDWLQRFMPGGVFLRGLVDDKSWITVGFGDEMPVFVAGSHALVSRSPVRTAVRLGEEEGLRLSGLLWPEARERLANAAYLTTERVGQGQVILFSASPVFRGYTRGTARLFENAVVYGPGLGASQPATW